MRLLMLVVRGWRSFQPKRIRNRTTVGAIGSDVTRTFNDHIHTIVYVKRVVAPHSGDVAATSANFPLL